MAALNSGLGLMVTRDVAERRSLRRRGSSELWAAMRAQRPLSPQPPQQRRSFRATRRARAPISEQTRSKGSHMPDAVRCSVDPSQAHTVNCEVEIGPEPSASGASSVSAAVVTPAPAAAPPAAPPAVAALVDRFVLSRKPVHAPPVDLVTESSVQTCAGQLLSAALSLMSAKSTPVAVLGAFKAGYDISACLSKDAASRQSSADERAMVADCESDGGVPTGFVGNDLMCLEPGAVTP